MGLAGEPLFSGPMANKSVLISGIGVAGPTLAYWLDKSGFRPTLVEHAPTCALAAMSSTSGVLATTLQSVWS